MEPFLGQIMTVGFSFAPRGWALCQGQILPISQYTALFSLLGTTYGGDGETTFGLPDLRGRMARGVGNGPGLDTVSWGERGGNYQHTLTQTQMPAHSHPVVPRGSGETADVDDPSGAFPGGGEFYAPTGTEDMGSLTSGLTGGSQPFNIMNPYLGLYVCIALVGIYPSRN